MRQQVTLIYYSLWRQAVTQTVWVENGRSLVPKRTLLSSGKAGYTTFASFLPSCHLLQSWLSMITDELWGTTELSGGFANRESQTPAFANEVLPQECLTLLTSTEQPWQAPSLLLGLTQRWQPEQFGKSRKECGVSESTQDAELENLLGSYPCSQGAVWCWASCSRDPH